MPLSAELSLYRQILSAARRFPSIKRNSIVEEIRVGFRENRNVQGEELKVKMDIAIKGLGQLEQYSGLKRQSTSWSVSLDTNPMPNNKADE
jgi:LYR motif-containing protein 4